MRRVLPFLIVGLLLACAAAIVFFFASLFQRDMRVLNGFVDSYESYDQAMTAAFDANGQNLPAPGTEAQAQAALNDLQARASGSISSLVKNEKEAMRLMQQIAALAERELQALRAYRQAASPDASRTLLAQTLQDLIEERRAAFAHFRELGK